MTRALVLMSLGRAADELRAVEQSDGPRPHAYHVARLLGADMASYASAAARRGSWFTRAFASRRPLGSAVSAVLDAGQYDRIYALDEDVGFRAGLMLRARGWRGRLTCLVHHVSPARARVLRLSGERPFGHFLTYTERQRDAVIACGIDPARVHNRPIPTDTGFFRPAAPARPPTVVAIGAADRDYPTLFRAAAGIDAEFQIFGHGYSGADAAGLSGEGLPPNVRLMPHAPVRVMRDHLAAAAVVALPLRHADHAAGATALVEAMACGRPVVTSASVGLMGYLGDARPGPVVPVGDADAMRAALAGLFADRQAADAQGARNRNWVLANARVEDFAELVAGLVRAG